MTCRRRLLPPLVLSGLALLIGCRSGRERLFREQRFLLGSVVEMNVAAADEKTAKAAMSAAFEEMARVEKIINAFDEESELSKLNKAGFPDGMVVSAELYGILRTAGNISQRTQGAFDCTVGALMKLWRFNDGGVLPDPADVSEALKAVGWHNVRCVEAERKVAFSRHGVSLDLGGIGEGYALSRARLVLDRQGISAGLINAGGDVMAWGFKPGGAEWLVGIQHPRRGDALLGKLRITDVAVVTSGDYERKFTAAGRSYHHILDPATGYPAEGVAGATVVASSPMQADALATAMVVMGPDRARLFLSQAEDAAAIIVDDTGGTYVSPRLRESYEPSP